MWTSPCLVIWLGGALSVRDHLTYLPLPPPRFPIPLPLPPSQIGGMEPFVGLCPPLPHDGGGGYIQTHTQ